MKIVQDLLRVKGADVHTIQPEASVYVALERLAEHDIGALIVLDGDRLAGILSERDYARKVALRGRTSHELQVRDIMTTAVIVVRPNQTVDECMTLMTERRVRHLPVVDAGRLVGLISIGDVVKAIISEQAFVINQLENYITGTR